MNSGEHIVTLANGVEMPVVLVTTTLLALRALVADGHGLAVYEARELARNRAHHPFGNAGDVLVSRGLAQRRTDGSYELESAVRDIVLCAVQGEGLDTRIENPVGQKASA